MLALTRGNVTIVGLDVAVLVHTLDPLHSVPTLAFLIDENSVSEDFPLRHAVSVDLQIKY
jgi:hypothetical protein